MRRLAPVLDLAALVVFVVLGRREHGLEGNATGLLSSLWPFLIGWFVVALLARLYTTPSWGRWAVTWIGGVALALALRIVIADHNFVASFTLVTVVVVGALTGGWRGVAALTRAAQPSS